MRTGGGREGFASRPTVLGVAMGYTAPAMTRVSALIPSLLFVALALPGCKKDSEPEAKDDKKEEPDPEPAPEPPPAEPRFDLSGPKPPETSTVLFAIDGALMPLACFDKDKGEIVAGVDCAKLVAEGSEVYMESSFGKKALEKTGAGTKMSMCGDDGAIPMAALDKGEQYDWGVWPKSLGPDFVQVHPDTWSDRGARLEEAEAKAAQDALAKAGKTKGEFQSKQKATVDIDGDGKDELFVSAILANPRDPDTHHYSGLLMAKGGDLAQFEIVDTVTRGSDEIKLFGATDLDGDGTRELWTGLSFDGGAGERVLVLGDEPKPLGKWSCGAG